MLAPSPTPTPTEQPTRLVTEAEAVCNLLLDMDVSLVARLDHEDLLFKAGAGTPSGAIDLVRITAARFEKDEEFREDVIGYVGLVGDYVASSQGVAADLKTANVVVLFQALTAAGLLPQLHRESSEIDLAFVPVLDRPIAANAHLLMRLATERFARELGFKDAAVAFLDHVDKRTP